jgi:NAD-dependent deacetylase sirtuin 5
VRQLIIYGLDKNMLMDPDSALKAIPNAGHIALAMLAVPEHLKTIAPFAKFTLVTQNVDGLSPRAFREVCPSGEPTLFEMHGHLFETICTVCNDRATNLDSPICPALAGTEELMEKHEERVIPLKDLPRCHKPDCDGLLRPGVVWFEEMPYHLKEINKIIDEADLALVVGSSSTVCYAFLLISAARYAHRSYRYTQWLDMRPR